jgi:hypothetical protein
MIGKVTLRQRFNAGLALAVVILLIFATNRLDQHHFETTQETVNTVFEDRVMAQDYIYRISNIINQKKIQMESQDASVTSSESNESLSQLLKEFESTNLTTEEAKQFALLENELAHLESLENDSRSLYGSQDKSQIKALAGTFLAIDTFLNKLAEIQLVESEKLTGFAQQSLDKTKLISRLEIALLIIAGIALQFVIFSRVHKHEEREAMKAV